MSQKDCNYSFNPRVWQNKRHYKEKEREIFSKIELECDARKEHIGKALEKGEILREKCELKIVDWEAGMVNWNVLPLNRRIFVGKLENFRILCHILRNSYGFSTKILRFGIEHLNLPLGWIKDFKTVEKLNKKALFL